MLEEECRLSQYFLLNVGKNVGRAGVRITGALLNQQPTHSSDIGEPSKQVSGHCQKMNDSTHNVGVHMVQCILVYLWLYAIVNIIPVV